MMGGCGDCKGDCSPKKGVGRPVRRQEVDIKTYLAPLPLSVTPDPTPLSRWCQHTPKPKYKRHMCLTCIKSFVWAVDYWETEEAIQKLKELGHKVAVDRLEGELKERKRKEIVMFVTTPEKVEVEVELDSVEVDIDHCDIEAEELVRYMIDKGIDTEVLSFYFEQLSETDVEEIVGNLSGDAAENLVAVAQALQEAEDEP
jgi:hypothetical protein